MSMITDPPTYVLTPAAVRWGIGMLASRKIHPTFAMYLHLRREELAGRLGTASAEGIKPLLAVPGTPQKPHYLPFIDRGETKGVPLPTFWRAENLGGMWSPKSIYRQVPGRWLSDNANYLPLPPDHIDLALKNMLYDLPVSAVALGAFFLRNDGFIVSGDPSPSDVVEGFRSKFEYPSSADAEFDRIFTIDGPTSASFEWFELAPVDNAEDELEGEEVQDA